MLGICYGMQLMVDQLGGEVRTPQHGGEYGRTIIRRGSLDGGVKSGPDAFWSSGSAHSQWQCAPCVSYCGTVAMIRTYE